MTPEKYLYTHRNKLYFRRRIPGFSARKRPLMIKIASDDRVLGHIWLERLTMEFDQMLDAFLLLKPDLPSELVLKYIHFNLSRTMKVALRQYRMARMTGRIGDFHDMALMAQKVALKSLIEDGLRKKFPVSKINPEWKPEFLEIVLCQHKRERDVILSGEMKDQIIKNFKFLTGHELNDLEHIRQLREAHLVARLTSLESLDSQYDAQHQAFRDLANQMTSNHFTLSPTNTEQTQPLSDSRPEFNSVNLAPSTVLDLAPPSVEQEKTSTKACILTPGVTLIDGSLTLEALSKQFKVAELCDELLHRSPKEQPYGVDIAGACERSIKCQIKDGKMEPKTADARRSMLQIFCLLTGVQTVTEVEQYHFQVFLDRIDKLPIHFKKSGKDLTRTMKEIQARAEDYPVDGLRRAPSKVNAYLETIGAVLNHARSNESSAVSPDINTTILRRPENTRGRKKRKSFKFEDTKALFQHTVWHGCKSNERRHAVGNVIEKDGLFWVPLIVAYTGARMEEIAGLTSDSIVESNGHWGFDIRPHEERRLKNLHSERLIPIHEHLIALGLLEHQQRMVKKGEIYLFPELKPKSAKKKFTSALRYNCQKIRYIQLEGNLKNLMLTACVTPLISS